MSALARSTIIEVARSYLGTPYRHQGRGRRGLDCIGLVLVMRLDLGFEPIRIPNGYSMSPSKSMVLKYSDMHMTSTDKTVETVVPGDVLVLWGWTRNEPQHFAVVGEHAGRRTMIHAWSKHSKVVEHPIDEFWSKRIEKVYEFPDTEAGQWPI